MRVAKKNKKAQKDTLLVTSEKIDLEAFWGTKPSKTLYIILQVFDRLRHQTAIAAYVTILGALKLAGIQAHHTEILSIAFASIAIIAIMTEWISRK